MSETPRVKALMAKVNSGENERLRPLNGQILDFLDMTELARTLERELNKANAIITAALAYVEEFKEFPMEEQLIAILEGKVPAANKNEE